MKTVFKYPLLVIDIPQKIELPKGATFRHAAMQNGRPCLWFEVETSREIESRYFRVFGTGHKLPDEVIWFCATVLTDLFVWHIYELREFGKPEKGGTL